MGGEQFDDPVLHIPSSIELPDSKFFFLQIIKQNSYFLFYCA